MVTVSFLSRVCWCLWESLRWPFALRLIEALSSKSTTFSSFTAATYFQSSFSASNNLAYPYSQSTSWPNTSTRASSKTTRLSSETKSFSSRFPFVFSALIIQVHLWLCIAGNLNFLKDAAKIVIFWDCLSLRYQFHGNSSFLSLSPGIKIVFCIFPLRVLWSFLFPYTHSPFPNSSSAKTYFSLFFPLREKPSKLAHV